MAWSILNTNATTFNGFLIALRNFLTSHSWTTLVDGTGGGGETLEMTNANGLDFKLSKISTARTDSFTGAFTDISLSLQYQKSDVGAASGYSTDSVASWDFAPAYSNLWFITDGVSCHIIAQVSPDRYTSASFGEIDPLGLHTEHLPYCAANAYVWWAQNTDYTSNVGYASNYPSNTSHNVGFFYESGGFAMGIPSGLLDTGLGFASGAITSPNVRQSCTRYYTDPAGSNTTGRLLDYISNISNHVHTGGVNLMPIPTCVFATNSIDHAFVGALPGICLVNMNSLSPAQVLTFGTEEWIVFPLKQTGTVQATNTEVNAQPDTNSAMYGFAFRKA